MLIIFGYFLAAKLPKNFKTYFLMFGALSSRPALISGMRSSRVRENNKSLSVVWVISTMFGLLSLSLLKIYALMFLPINEKCFFRPFARFWVMENPHDIRRMLLSLSRALISLI
jgi:hypothetical protein